MKQQRIKLELFKDGTILWTKILLVILILVSLSYFLSKIKHWLGIVYFFYGGVISAPSIIGIIFQSPLSSLIEVVGFLLFPVYLLVAVNYFYLYFKKRVTLWWLTTIFIILSIIYWISVLIGLFIGLVWHP